MSSRWKDAAHLFRMAGLFAVGIGMFAGARAVLVPSDFGELGHYRTGALAANRERPLAFAGEAACVSCHEEADQTKRANAHRVVRCESCHGPQAAHAEGGAAPPRPAASPLCVNCHQKMAARPRTFPQVEPAAHSGGEACTTCHAAHAPRME